MVFGFHSDQINIQIKINPARRKGTLIVLYISIIYIILASISIIHVYSVMCYFRKSKTSSTIIYLNLQQHTNTDYFRVLCQSKDKDFHKCWNKMAGEDRRAIVNALYMRIPGETFQRAGPTRGTRLGFFYCYCIYPLWRHLFLFSYSVQSWEWKLMWNYWFRCKRFIQERLSACCVTSSHPTWPILQLTTNVSSVNGVMCLCGTLVFRL